MGLYNPSLIKRAPRWLAFHRSPTNFLKQSRTYVAIATSRVWAGRSNSKARSVVWARGAKRSSKLKLEELPQGTLPLDPLPSDIEPTYPTVIQQARTNMDRFPHCVVITRVGGFYEARVLQTLLPIDPGWPFYSLALLWKCWGDWPFTQSQSRKEESGSRDCCDGTATGAIWVDAEVGTDPKDIRPASLSTRWTGCLGF